MGCKEGVDVTQSLGRAGLRMYPYIFLPSSVDAQGLRFLLSNMVIVLVSCTCWEASVSSMNDLTPNSRHCVLFCLLHPSF